MIPAEVRRADVDELIQQGLASAATRQQLATGWRGRNEDLVAELERRSTEELGKDAAALMRRFGDEAVLLGLVTDPDESPSALALTFLHGLPGAQGKKAWKTWRKLQPPTEPEASVGRHRRVVIIGGHPRETRVADELDSEGLALDWRVCIKGRGRASEQRALRRIAGADAVVVVTGRVSHSVMERARRTADELRIPCHFVERATARQLAGVLREITHSLDGRPG